MNDKTLIVIHQNENLAAKSFTDEEGFKSFLLTLGIDNPKIKWHDLAEHNIDELQNYLNKKLDCVLALFTVDDEEIIITD